MFNLTFHKEGYENSYSGDTEECPKPRIKLMRGDIIEYFHFVESEKKNPHLSLKSNGKTYTYDDWFDFDFSSKNRKIQQPTQSFSVTEICNSNFDSTFNTVSTKKYIYFFPNWGSGTSFKIEPDEKIKLNLSTESWSHCSSIISKNGNIYIFPKTSNNSHKIRKINKNSDIITELDFNLQECFGAVIGKDGKKIYTVPHNSSVIYELDTETDNVTSFGDLGLARSKYCSGTIAENGKIYMAPYDSRAFLELDTDTKTINTFYFDLPLRAFQYGSCSVWNEVLVTAYEYGGFATFDIVNKTLAKYNEVGFKPYSFKLANDGNVYCLAERKLHTIDTATKTVTKVSEQDFSYFSLFRSGKLFGANNGKVFEIDLKQGWQTSGFVSPFFNTI